MTRVTRSKSVKLHDEVKENRQNNEIVAESVRTPRKRLNKTTDVENGDCSPTKTRKDEPDSPKTPGVSNLFNASLSLDTPKSNSKYSSARRALSSNKNFLLPGREKEIEGLKEFIDSAVDEKRSCSLYLSGQPGTGEVS